MQRISRTVRFVNDVELSEEPDQPRDRVLAATESTLLHSTFSLGYAGTAYKLAIVLSCSASCIMPMSSSRAKGYRAATEH